MKITRLKDHAVIKIASNVVSGYIAKCHPTVPDKDPKATRKESYAIETFLSLSNILTCIDQLYFSIDMLTGYRKKDSRTQLNRYDYIVFGIENYYLRLTSVYDRCLRLGNVVFQLGLPERECRSAAITENAYIKGTSVAQALRDLDKFTTQFRFHRNTVAHESTYSERILNKLGAYYYLVGTGDDAIVKHGRVYKSMTDDYVAKRKAEFRKQLEEIERLVGKLFEAIHSSFRARLKAIDKA